MRDMWHKQESLFRLSDLYDPILGWYSQKGSSSSWANNQLKFTAVYTKLELILAQLDLEPFGEYSR